MKVFNDRLSRALLLPLAALGAGAAGLGVLFLELAVGGEDLDASGRWARPLMAFTCGYCGVLLGGKIAPERKLLSAAALGLLYMAALVLSGAGGEYGPGPRGLLLLSGAFGVALAVLRHHLAQARGSGDGKEASPEQAP